MPTSKSGTADRRLELPADAVRRLFRASAQALMANRPLREMTLPGAGAAVLSTTELKALHAVGFSTQPFVAEATDDPLAKTIVDYMALIETSLSTAEVAGMLKVDVSRIRQRVREQSLLGIEYEGEWRLPCFQFERKKVLPDLAEVLTAFPEEMNALDIATWFLQPHTELDVDENGTTVNPRTWLLLGRSPERLSQLAQHV